MKITNHEGEFRLLPSSSPRFYEKILFFLPIYRNKNFESKILLQLYNDISSWVFVKRGRIFRDPRKISN